MLDGLYEKTLNQEKNSKEPSPATDDYEKDADLNNLIRQISDNELGEFLEKSFSKHGAMSPNHLSPPSEKPQNVYPRLRYKSEKYLRKNLQTSLARYDNETKI